jgi:hypothetical protein
VCSTYRINNSLALFFTTAEFEMSSNKHQNSSVSFEDTASSKLRKTGHNPNFDSWEVGSRYHLTEILGKGSYGHVAKALDM